MESRISIDIDEQGQPYIWVDFKPSDDLRDKVLSRFLTASRVWMRADGEIDLPLALHIVHAGGESGKVQAMIQPSPRQIEERYMIVLSHANVVKKGDLNEDDLADAQEGHSSIIDLLKKEVNYKGVWLAIEKGL